MTIPSRCEHCNAKLGVYEIDQSMYCDACGKCVGVVCPACGGGGDVIEADYECDWVNYSDQELITCPECGGVGWTADPSFQ